MAEVLTSMQIKEALRELPGWAHEGEGLVKTFKFKNFREALSFIVRVGLEAEAINHHPDLRNVYNSVRIALSTHDAGGKVTGMDVALARAIQHLSWVG